MRYLFVLLAVVLLCAVALWAQTPYGDTPRNIPGLVQAEDFDEGASGLAYVDTTSVNAGWRYRQTAVDIESTSDVGGGYNVGWVQPGEWLHYTVNVTTAGLYRLDVRVSANGTGGTFHVEFNGQNKTGAITVPATGGWQRWQTVTRVVTLAAGVQPMRLVFDTKGTYAVGNFNWLSLTAVPPPTTTPTLRVMTWNVHRGEGGSASTLGKFIADQNAQVVAVQECPVTFCSALQTALSQQTDAIWYAAASGEHDVRLFSRLPYKTSEWKTIGRNSWWPGVRVAVRGEVTLGTTLVHVWSTHLDIARNWTGGFVLENANTLLSWTRNFSGARLVLAGDFNANASSGDPLQRQVATVFGQNGFVDSSIETYGSNAAVPATNNSWRPDAIYRSSGLRTISSRVVPSALSDHKAIVSEFAVQ